MTPATLALADGVHLGIPFADYLAIPAVSRSGTIDPIRRSPAYYQATRDIEGKRTPSLILGSALNDLTLQPHLFPDRFALVTKCVARTAEGKPCTSNGSILTGGVFRCGKHADKSEHEEHGKMPLTPEQHELALTMATAIQASPEASEFLRITPDREVTLLWTDRRTGVRCKGRVDICGTTNPFRFGVGDLKHSRAAGPNEFPREAAKFGYHRQAAWYLAGFRALGVQADEFVDVVVANTPPHEVYVYSLIQDAIVQGDFENRAALDLYVRCRDEGKWPGGGAYTLSLPAYAMSQDQDDDDDANDGAVEVA